ncbi:MAG: DUF5666 domain-containing protein [Chloroflexota bacterium]|nr:hypothetical protein [Chloroflexota bacterium]MBI5703856.1 hypothetical protein [Chloroflexota bacterium]
MNKSHRFLISVLLIGAYLLSACSGTLPSGAVRESGSADDTAGSQYTEVVFTGNVEAMDASQWTISGQVISVEGASIDAGIQVGDIVKVEAKVAADGSILALKIEVASPDDNANDNMNGNVNDNANDNDNMNGNVNDNANDNDNMNGNVNDNDNDNANMNGNDNEADDEQEVYGVVEALAMDSVTVNGMTYAITASTKFKTIVAVGDYVKLHLAAAADGSLFVREIEKKSPDDNSNENTNGNDNDDDSYNENSNSNSNSNYNGNSNSNDDDDHNGNSNGNDNGDDDDDNSNDNGNSNGDD